MQTKKKFWFILALLLTLVSEVAHAESDTEIAQRLFRMLTDKSLMPENPRYNAIMTAVANRDYAVAADIIMGGATGTGVARTVSGEPAFYDVTLKRFAEPLNRDELTGGPANEAIAMVVGNAMDDNPIQDLLNRDFTYLESDPTFNTGGTAYDERNDAHYTELHKSRTFLSPTFQLRIRSATGVVDDSFRDGPGIFGSRTFGQSYYDMGTNRRPWIGIANFLYCVSDVQLKDTAVPDFFVRRDVARIQNGSMSNFVNDCRGCHGVMDSVTRAFSRWDFQGGRTTRNSNTTNYVKASVNGNATTFPETQFVVTNDSWTLPITDTQNQILGIPDSKRAGTGVAELGSAIAESDGFYRCMAKRAVSQIYLKKTFSVRGMNVADLRRLSRQGSNIERFARSLKQHRRLKTLFKEVALYYLLNVSR